MAKTFKQFLEQEEHYPGIDEFLDKHCNKFLDELHDDEDGDVFEDAVKALYRGMDDPGKLDGTYLVPSRGEMYEAKVYIKNVRKDREPRDTHPQIAEVLDELFKKKFGWAARTQGLFVFGKKGYGPARDFGDLYSVMPMGNFRFLWSPQVNDLTTEAGRKLRAKGFVYNIEHEYSDEELKDISKVLEEIVDTYKDTDFKGAVNSMYAREIMIDCNQYAAFARPL